MGFLAKIKSHVIVACARPKKIDWTALTNTEKMVKAMLLKAQITAELNGQTKAPF